MDRETLDGKEFDMLMNGEELPEKKASANGNNGHDADNENGGEEGAEDYAAETEVPGLY